MNKRVRPRRREVTPPYGCSKTFPGKFVGADAHIRPWVDVGIDPYNSTATTVSTSPATRNLMFTPP